MTKNFELKKSNPNSYEPLYWCYMFSNQICFARPRSGSVVSFTVSNVFHHCLRFVNPHDLVLNCVVFLFSVSEKRTGPNLLNNINTYSGGILVYVKSSNSRPVRSNIFSSRSGH